MNYQKRYLIKIEEHYLEIETFLMVKYLGDQCMGPQGIMCLVINKPKEEDFLGEIVAKALETSKKNNKGPPTGYSTH